MEDSKNHGFHIQNILDPNARYLGENYEFVSPVKALLFLEKKHAEDYAKANGIALGSSINVIVPCKCFDFVRADHPIANVYN